MKKFLYRLIDRISEWDRYPQPNWFQKRLLGMYTDSIDTDFTARKLASVQSVRFILENMRKVKNFPTDYDLHEYVSTKTLDPELRKTGLVLEFGVATGRTLNQFARFLPEKTVHGFDGFDGLPEVWDSRYETGAFKRDTLPDVRNNCKLHVGWFDYTLPEFLEHAAHQAPIALLHIDADLYSSTKTVLDLLQKQIVPGTVIVFDEYLNYPGWQLDEFRAWQEHVAAHRIKFEYIGYVSRHQQVAVRVLK